MISTSARSVGKHVVSIGQKAPHYPLRNISHVQHSYVTCRVKNTSQLINLLYLARNHYATITTKSKAPAKSTRKSTSKSSPKPSSKSSKSSKSSSKKTKAAASLKKKKVVSSKKSPLKSKKVLKKKKVPAKKKPVKKVRKVAKKTLTEEQKLALKLKKTRLLVLTPPNTLPRTARSVFFAQKMTGQGSNVKNVLSAIAPQWKDLPNEEKELYNKKAEENKALNEKSFKKWLAGYTPDQVRIANNARKQLNKYAKRRVWSPIQDDRLPKRPLSVFMCYMKERHGSSDLKGKKAQEIAKVLGQEFNSLSPIQRKKYDDIARTNQERYVEEFKLAYNRNSMAKVLPDS